MVPADTFGKAMPGDVEDKEGATGTARADLCQHPVERPLHIDSTDIADAFGIGCERDPEAAASPFQKLCYQPCALVGAADVAKSLSIRGR